MAEIVWTEPAVADLDGVADWIAVDDPGAARRFVARVVQHVSLLASWPAMGPVMPESGGSRYRQLVERPCRVINRAEKERILIVCILRTERLIPDPIEPGSGPPTPT